MEPVLWWKNFALGIELDAAGTFIYNGIRALHEMHHFQHPVDSFEVLYNLSVGIERLLKVAIILVEHSDDGDQNALEESLITHNTLQLLDRLNGTKNLQLQDVHREFLAILSKFYKSHRYGRYSFGIVPNISEEKSALVLFLKRHLSLDVDVNDEFMPLYNTNQIRKFVGKIVKKVSSGVFDVIRNRASELNIYTDELRGDSKAIKVFYGNRLDFVDEEIKKKEFILFLMNPSVKSKYIELLRDMEPLDMDVGMAPSYIRALLNDADLPFVEEAVDEAYTELSNVKDRLQFLEVMDSEHLSYDEEDDA